jgi:dolichyldiphosphatase
VYVNSECFFGGISKAGNPDDDTSHLSLVLAFITLSPVLLMVCFPVVLRITTSLIEQASYAALAVQTRELTIILMWAGQFLCEAFNYILKGLIKEERPSSA